MNHRLVVRWLVLTLVATGLAATAAWRFWPATCGEGDELVPASGITDPLPGDPGDRRLQRLIDTAGGWGLGEVVGAVGYDHNRFIEFAGLPDALGVWRRGDPVFVVTDPADGHPLWGLRQAEQRRTWDASARRFVSVGVPAGTSPEISVRRLEDGRQVWCARVPDTPVEAADPISTAVLENQDVLFLAGKVGSQRLTSLSGSSGRVRWTQPLRGIDRGDFIGIGQQGTLVVGGRPPYELSEPPSPDRDVLSGLEADSGRTRWTHRVPAGTTASAIGDDGGIVAMLQRAETDELVALDEETGRVLWRQSLAGADHDATVRGGVVLVRTERRLAAHDLATGKPLWSNPIRRQPQRFPYGFRLAEQPMRSDHELVLGATDALVVLDVRSGSERELPLPTDGLSTTYWPYRVVTTPDGLALATNTGAVLVAE